MLDSISAELVMNPITTLLHHFTSDTYPALTQHRKKSRHMFVVCLWILGRSARVQCHRSWVCWDWTCCSGTISPSRFGVDGLRFWLCSSAASSRSRTTFLTLVAFFRVSCSCSCSYRTGTSARWPLRWYARGAATVWRRKPIGCRRSVTCHWRYAHCRSNCASRSSWYASSCGWCCWSQWVVSSSC